MKEIMIVGFIGIALTSCNVTRTIVTKSEVRQDGETKTVIESRTVESYDASRKFYLVRPQAQPL